MIFNDFSTLPIKQRVFWWFVFSAPSERQWFYVCLTFYENHWKSMKINENHWKSIEIYGALGLAWRVINKNMQEYTRIYRNTNHQKTRCFIGKFQESWKNLLFYRQSSKIIENHWKSLNMIKCQLIEYDQVPAHCIWSSDDW